MRQDDSSRWIRLFEEAESGDIDACKEIFRIAWRGWATDEFDMSKPVDHKNPGHMAGYLYHLHYGKLYGTGPQEWIDLGQELLIQSCEAGKSDPKDLPWHSFP